MAEGTRKLVVLLTHGVEDERATVALTMANGGMTSGLEVSLFLVSAGVDLVRKGAADLIQLNPFDPPLKELLQDFIKRGGKIWVCPPCAKVRGYDQDDFIEGVVIHGSSVVHDLIKDGAATLSF